MNLILKWKEWLSLFHHEILILFLIIFPVLAYGGVQLWSMTIVHITVILAITLSLVTTIKNGQFVITKTPLDLYIFLFFVLEVLSLFYSANTYNSRISLYKSISYLVVFYFVINHIKSKKQIMLLMWAIVIFGTLYATAALSIIGSEFLGFKNFSNSEYITLTFVNRDHFSGYLEMIVWLAVGMAFVHSGSKRVLLLFLAAYTASAIFFSLSRGGILSFLASSIFISIVLSFFDGKKRHLLVIGSFLLLLAFTLIWIGMEPIITRMETLSNPAVAGRGRLEYWSGTYQMILHNFWFGTGLGSYSSAYPQYQTAFASHLFVSHAHNDYLELAAEMGAIGFVSFASILVAFFVNILKKARTQKDPDLRILGILILASVFSIIIHSGTDFNFHIPSNVILFVVIGAIAINAIIHENKKQSDELHIIIPRINSWYFLIPLLLIVSILILIVTLPYIGSQYFAEAKKYQIEKNYDSALKAVDKAISFDNDNPEYYARKASINYLIADSIFDIAAKRSFLQEALINFDKAIAIHPVNSYYYTKRAFVLQKLHQNSQAEISFLMAVTYFSNSPYMHYNLANFYHEQEDYFKADKEYTSCLKLGTGYFHSVVKKLESEGKQYVEIRDVIPQIASLRHQLASHLSSQKNIKKPQQN